MHPKPVYEAVETATYQLWATTQTSTKIFQILIESAIEAFYSWGFLFPLSTTNLRTNFQPRDIFSKYFLLPHSCLEPSARGWSEFQCHKRTIRTEAGEPPMNQSITVPPSSNRPASWSEFQCDMPTNLSMTDTRTSHQTSLVPADQRGCQVNVQYFSVSQESFPRQKLLMAMSTVPYPCPWCPSAGALVDGCDPKSLCHIEVTWRKRLLK